MHKDSIGCSVACCDSPAFCRGFCQKHYYRFKNHGTTDLHPRFTARACSVEGCKGKATRKGLCSKHYSRLRYTGTTRASPPKTCGIDGCQKEPIKTVRKNNCKIRLCAAHLRDHKREIEERRLRKKKKKEEMQPSLSCRQCGEPIASGTTIRGRLATIHCSPRCVSRERDGKPDKEPCVICGALFKAINGRNVCSDACKTIKRSEDSLRSRRRTQYHKRKYVGDSPYRLARMVRAMLWRVLSATGEPKSDLTFEALGYSADELRNHIERQFTRGMSWDLVGPEIHIDHIIPVAEFIRQGETRAEVINALPNLRPLWAKQNMLKKDRMVSLL